MPVIRRRSRRSLMSDAQLGNAEGGWVATAQRAEQLALKVRGS
jgi:hypothetical protein